MLCGGVQHSLRFFVFVPALMSSYGHGYHAYTLVCTNHMRQPMGYERCDSLTRFATSAQGDVVCNFDKKKETLMLPQPLVTKKSHWSVDVEEIKHLRDRNSFSQQMLTKLRLVSPTIFITIKR